MRRAALGVRGEALFHLLQDLGMLGLTIGTLWLCLRKYKPLDLGLFRSRFWPPKWAPKVLIACAMTFPVALFLESVSQVLTTSSVSVLSPWGCQNSSSFLPGQGRCSAMQ
jgi:hypothetical protein